MPASWNQRQSIDALLRVFEAREAEVVALLQQQLDLQLVLIRNDPLDEQRPHESRDMFVTGVMRRNGSSAASGR